MFSGSLVAMTTPFNQDGIDQAALRKMVRWQLEQGTNALVPCGTTGESATLSETEHRQVIDIVLSETAGQVPVIAGAGSNNPIEAIKYSQHALAAGAQAALHVAGYYNRPSQEGLFRHFKAVTSACEIPVIVYNIPARAIVDIEPDTMARIAALPNIVGVKDATADLSRPILEQQRLEQNQITTPFYQLSGEDLTAVAYNAAGGNGCISVTANIAPALCAQMQSACRDGDFQTAIDIQRRLAPLHEALFLEPSPAGVKFASSLLGLGESQCRLPIIPLSETTQNRITNAMRVLNLL
ncbi:MAG: 4-hydroxy-tetrahydrodipicolinate synthase [Burkholderiaceae bacterium]